ncbi:MAG: hypothetical protein IJE60_06195 [Tyzzerella sp.]|nr:hypothetical protein [Tyzzerella sp.]
MENENILKQMVADKMVLTVVDPTDYSEVECHIEGGNGDYSLVSNDAQAPSEEELEANPFAEPTGFILQIRRLVAQGTNEFYILCDGVDDYFEVIDIN